ncbi:MarR family winged helix-turn-helix transcriptional regulator [Bradyrhizobium sp. NP1]|uniref:MarR family winged helix-turn-helix transcriptional regulator n=1 Tax=Bradyrhizobium sp. NP1 TaxID=3049772 RepID=UPI0025A63358|nr:MarR family winged helix-turn-helix transcriptional regulator [Bradyrhizobium sp. NP1]WJR75516.1 MarR family winged helix-turn-helix transcriptional regulator [Bradyrhizobium sp. NP1]
MPKAAKRRSEPNAVAPESAEPLASLELRAWIPYRCSVVANRVSHCLERMYGEQYGLTVPGWRIMANLGRYAPLSAKEVAERTAMDQVQVTRAITQMASVGLISRRVDVEDRRRVVLRLSQKGLDAYAQIVPLAKAIEKKLLAGLSASERSELSRLTEKLMLSAEATLGDDVDWRKFVTP